MCAEKKCRVEQKGFPGGFPPPVIDWTVRERCWYLFDDELVWLQGVLLRRRRKDVRSGGRMSRMAPILRPSCERLFGGGDLRVCQGRRRGPDSSVSLLFPARYEATHFPLCPLIVEQNQSVTHVDQKG
jgi:hypothetical protein